MPAPEAADTPLSPRQTVEKLIAFRKAARFDDMLPLIVASDGPNVVRLIQAADDFTQANRDFVALVRAKIGEIIADGVDCGSLAENLDIFSSFVTPLDERIDGETATVTFTIEGRLPTRSTTLRRIDGAWRYDPGDARGADAAAAIAKMAEGLREVRKKLESGAIDTARVRADPNLLVGELQRTLAAGAALLPSTRPAPKNGG